MKVVCKFLFISVSGLSIAAAEAPSISGNVALTTDYVWRGVSQSDSGPAVQGGFDYENGNFYAGVWASNVDFGDDTSLELDVYGGVTGDVGGFGIDVGFIYYSYPDASDLPTGTQNFYELYAGASRAFGDVEVSTMLSYSPDFYGETGEAYYWANSVSVPLGDVVSLSAGYNASFFGDETLNDEYQDYNIGLTAPYCGVDIDLRFHDTTGRAGADDQTVVLSVSKSF